MIDIACILYKALYSLRFLTGLQGNRITGGTGLPGEPDYRGDRITGGNGLPGNV